MINGIINVYKEPGFTSFDVVAKLRGIYHQKKIGHTGTLDPDAEGVLPICLGKATKVCQFLTDHDKVYEATLLLGQETDTQDTSGTILHQAEVTVNEEEVRLAIASFVGKYNQLPPMYSALKVNGQKLCDLARNGITVERKTREIEIFSIEILEVSLPEVRMLVHCSKGTYIRTLCKDIGDKLGCYGCMKKLIRTKVAGFEIANAYKISELEKAPLAPIMSIDSLFLDLQKAMVVPEAKKLLENGNKLPREFVVVDFYDTKELLRFYTNEDEFIGLYEYIEKEECYKPKQIFMEW